MQCLSCSKTFATELSVCPSCGKMPTQHHRAAIIAASRAPSRRSAGGEETFERKTSNLNESAFTAPAVQLSAPETISDADQQFSSTPKKEFMSTLIEFPKRTKTPEWRDAVRERVQAAKERRQCESEPQRGEAKPAKAAKAKPAAEEPSVAAQQPAMVIDLKPNIERPANRLVARALERVERSRQTHRAPLDADEQPNGYDNAPETAPAKNDFIKSVKIETKRTFPAAAPFAPNAANTVETVAGKISQSIDDFDFADSPVEEASKLIERIVEKPPQKSVEPAIEKVIEKTVAPPIVELQSAPVEPKNGKTPILSITSDADAERFLESSLPSVAGAAKKEARAPRNVIAEQEVLPRARQREAAEAAEDYAPIFGRAIAGALDLLLCAAVAFLIVAPFVPLEAFALENLTFRTALTTIGIFAAIKFVYLTLGLTLSETTVGLRLFGLRVVHAEDASAPTLVEAAINSAVYLFTLTTGGVALAAVLFSPEKRALHDLLSGTVVIRDN